MKCREGFTKMQLSEVLYIYYTKYNGKGEVNFQKENVSRETNKYMFVCIYPRKAFPFSYRSEVIYKLTFSVASYII